MDVHIAPHGHAPDDDRQITALLLRAFVDEGHTARDHAARLTDADVLRRRGVIIVARGPRPDGPIVGMVILAADDGPARQAARPGEAEVQLLAVAPAARGHGIGARLVAHCEAAARARGCSGMVLSTQPAMAAAHRVYQGLGFRRDAGRDWARGDGRNFLVYVKDLGA